MNHAALCRVLLLHSTMPGTPCFPLQALCRLEPILEATWIQGRITCSVRIRLASWPACRILLVSCRHCLGCERFI